MLKRVYESNERILDRQKKKNPSSGRFRSVDLGVAINEYEPHMLLLHHRAGKSLAQDGFDPSTLGWPYTSMSPTCFRCTTELI